MNEHIKKLIKEENRQFNFQLAFVAKVDFVELPEKRKFNYQL